MEEHGSRSGGRARTRRLLLLGLAALGLALIPAATANTPDPASVTIAGSLQSELGCPGDWQPECAATHLQPVDGQPGVFRGTFDVPPGGTSHSSMP